MADKIRNYKRMKALLNKRLGREANIEEIAAEMKISLKKINNIISAMQKDPVSLETPITENLTLSDYLEDENSEYPENNVQKYFLEKDVQKVLKELSNREQKILTDRFGINGENPKTLKQIGEETGFSKERIRQIENFALLKIRQSKHKKRLKEYIKE